MLDIRKKLFIYFVTKYLYMIKGLFMSYVDVHSNELARLDKQKEAKINDYEYEALLSISCIAWVEGLHGLSTVYRNNIRSHGNNTRIGPQAVTDAANITPTAVVVTVSDTASNFAAVRIDLGHFIGHTEPGRTTAGSMIPSSAKHSTTVVPPTIGNHELTHLACFYFEVVRFIFCIFSN